MSKRRRDEPPKAGQSRSKRYRSGLPGHHDPTAGIGGAAPGQSAFDTSSRSGGLRVVQLRSAGDLAVLTEAPMALVIVTVILGAVAAIDLGVIVRRKRRGEPGQGGEDVTAQGHWATVERRDQDEEPITSQRARPPRTDPQHRPGHPTVLQ